MNPDVLRALRTDLQALERRGVRYRQGVVTTAAPLAVAFGASTVPNTGLQALSSYYPAVGDVVAALSFGNDLLVLGPIGTTPRTAYTYSNGWRNYAMTASTFADQGFFRDASRVVHLEGVIDKNSGNWVGAETMITLPAGYRPPSTRMFAVRVSSNAGAVEGMGRIDVTSAGLVVLQNGGAANPVQWLALDGITFRAA